MKTIGFIGLGEMGRRMAQNILKQGYSLQVYNRSKLKARSLLEMGAGWQDTPKKLAQSSDIIISMVRDDGASRDIWCDPETGALAGLDGSKIAIESSTLSISWVEELSGMMSEAGISFVEAPVVGTLPQAENGELVHLITGNDSTEIRQLLNTMSKKTIWLENSGDASKLKLAINSLFAIQTVAFSEWLHTLAQAGFKMDMLAQLFPKLPITSPIMSMIIGQISVQQFTPLFPVNLVEKDLGYASSFVSDTLGRSEITEKTRDLFTQAVEQDFGQLNISGVSEIFAKKDAQLLEAIDKRGNQSA